MDATRRLFPTGSLPAEVAKLLEEALSQPGVREAMEVYQNWREVDEAVRPYRMIAATRTVVSASNNSVPTAESP